MRGKIVKGCQSLYDNQTEHAFHLLENTLMEERSKQITSKIICCGKA